MISRSQTASILKNLKWIETERGDEFFFEADRLFALLSDLQPSSELRKYNRLLATSIDACNAYFALKGLRGSDLQFMKHKLVNTLVDDCLIAEEMARWVIDLWAELLTGEPSGAAAQSYERAIESYTKLSKENKPPKPDRAAVFLDHAEPIASSRLKWYEEEALLGKADAQYKLGRCYHSGNGVELDMRKAVEWYTKAAEQGHIDAQNILGNCYYVGMGVLKDYKRAAEWYRRAAAAGDARGQYYLGNCYYIGNGVLRDYKKAVEWLTKAAEQGHATAQNNLGVCYRKGRGVQKNFKLAEEWYKKAAAQGYATASDNLMNN